MNRKYIITSTIVFFTLILSLLYKCYQILGYYDNTHSPAVFKQFYDLPDKTVDVVWLGASSVQEFIIPTVMFDETGIAIYSLSVGNEPFMSTRYLIEECEKKQDPELYLVDIRQLAYIVEEESYIRRITDNMKFSSNRDDAIRYMVGNLDRYRDHKITDNKIDYLFSLTKYHTRWGDLHREDFADDEECFFGYWIKTGHQEFDAETHNNQANIAAIAISDESEQYLSDVLDYCDTLGKKVIFTHTPNCLDEEKVGMYKYIQSVIEGRGYEIWDLNKEVKEIGIDFKTDFADPMHTNVYGAQKVSLYAGRKLMERFGFDDHRGDVRYKKWVEMSKCFHNKLQEAELINCGDFSEYLDRLNNLNKNDYSIFMAVKDIQGYNLTPEHIDELKRLGFENADMLLEHIYHSFIGAIANGGVICSKVGANNDPEQMMADSVSEDMVINGQQVSLTSSVWKNGNLGSIKLGEVDYSKNLRGFNIVVVDNKDRKVLDTVAFDTFADGIPCTR